MDDDFQYSKPSDAEPLYPQLVKLLKKLAIACAVFFGCSAVFILYVGLLENGSLERWQTSLSLPRARKQFNSQLEVINEIVQGTLIDEMVESPSVPDIYFHHCIFGYVSRVYGSDRPYEAIVTDYVEAFTDMGWTHAQSQSREDHHVFRLPVEDDPSVSRHRASIQLSSFNDDASTFQTTYEFRYSYRYPSFYVCTA
jgi:hypothetical protein